MPTTPPTVLLIEDNEDDVFLMRRALNAAQLEVILEVAEDGEQALEYLQSLVTPGTGQQRPFPDLVLLDLKLPYVHGFEVLAYIREQEKLRDLNVVVLTSSGELSDERRSSELQAHGYFVKPPTLAMITEIAKLLAAETAPKPA